MASRISFDASRGGVRLEADSGGSVVRTAHNLSLLKLQIKFTFILTFRLKPRYDDSDVPGYDVQSLLMYLILAVIVTYNQATCCYDGNVPGGVPHCYC